MARVTTSSGFTADIDESFRDDWELIEAFNAISNGTAGAVAKLADVVLGKSKDALKEHCRGENGRVSADKMQDELFEIIKATAKNS